MLAYREEQKLRQWWVIFIVMLAVVSVWNGFVRQVFLDQTLGTNPPPQWVAFFNLALFGIALPVVWYLYTLIVEVRKKHVLVQIAPFWSREIPMREIQKVEAITYRPLLDYGGWGVRTRRGTVAYTVSGNQGVQLTLNDGRKILLGSQDADALAKAIQKKL